MAALEGTYASVIGGAPAAAVVFAREVDRRTRPTRAWWRSSRRIADPRAGDKRRACAPELEGLRAPVRSEKLGEVAEEFDRVHSVERAREVGSHRRILPPARLRPYLIDAVERGMARELKG